MTVAALPREFKELPIALIDAPALPSRSSMDDEQMEDLVASIRRNGLLQNLIVARVGDRFEVVAGHRRRIACERAGLVTVHCIVYGSREDALDAAQHDENTKREVLSAADEAIWFSDLLQRKCGGDIDKLCALVGEKLSYVDNRISLFSGDPVVFEALQRGQIGIGVAHKLNECPDQKFRRYYLDCAIRGGATVAVVVGWLTEYKTLHGDQPQRPVTSEPSEPGIHEETSHPFTCEVCGKHDNVHLIRQVNVHSHCKLAILDPMLKAYHGVE